MLSRTRSFSSGQMEENYPPSRSEGKFRTKDAHAKQNAGHKPACDLLSKICTPESERVSDWGKKFTPMELPSFDQCDWTSGPSPC